MADDKLIFPIGFDLEAAVKNAGDDWDKKYADRLEKLIAKRSVNVKLKLDTSKLDSLDAVKKRLAELKIEPITPETKTAIRELARELQTLAKALEQVQKYSTGRAAASPDAVRAARINEINTRSEAKAAVEREKARAAAARAEQAELRLAQARTRAAAAATRSAEATRNLNREYKTQDGYISRLIKRLAVYAGFSAIGTFLSRVREVTAEFELQRVSLGAIIQDQQRANQLFSEIKAFALQSPLKILDLTKYTKQVAAYGIETKKLFSTTKMLADISVGLGVGMERLTLFLGQVYATGYLRASEVRQATEAGIPLVDKLAKKLSEANGKLVTAADVMDMISKRAISFEQVEEVFKDMTSAGGEFYNMQVKQSQTLFGMWSKLGDAAALMYDQIGNTSSVNSAMKTTIGLLENMMRNWKTTGIILSSLTIGVGTYALALKNASVASKALTFSESARLAITKAQVITTPKLVAAIIGQNAATKLSATLTKAHTAAMLKQSVATNVLSRAFWGLSAAMLANPWAIALAAIVAAGYAIYQFSTRVETVTEKVEKMNKSVSSLKNLDDNIKPLIDTYSQLINKTERTAEEQRKLSEVTQELAKRYPGAVSALGEFGDQIEFVSEKLTKLYEAERKQREEIAKADLEKLKSDYDELIKKREYYAEQIAAGGRYVESVDKHGARTIEYVKYNPEQIRYFLDVADDIDNQLLELNNTITATERALGLVSSAEEEAIDKFGAWRKELKSFRVEVEGGVNMQLFDDSTINQFKSLDDAMKTAAADYKKQIELIGRYDKALQDMNATAESRAKIEQERAEAQASANANLAALTRFGYKPSDFDKSRGGRTSDPRLSILQEMVSTLKQVNKEYDELAKKEGATKALEDTTRIYKQTFDNIKALSKQYGFDLPKFGVPTDTASLTKYLEAVKKAMAKLPKSDKAVLALQVDIEKLNIDDMQKQIEAKLKTLSDRISRTKTAREFYDRILAQTGDVEMAGTLTMNVYGEGGEDLFNNTVKLLQEYFSGVEVELPINFATQQIDYKALREIWEADKALPKKMRKIPEAYDSAIKQMLDSADSANQKMIEGWLKATEKAKTYSDKLADVYRTTATEIERIKKAMEIGDIDASIGAGLIAGYERKQAEAISQLEYEAFKNMPLYVQMFDDLNNASTSTLSNMRNRLIAMQGEWKNLDPTQLKEMQSRLNEIDAQLAQRNPFKTLSTSIKEYKDLQRDHGGESKLNKEIEVATDAYLEAKAALKKQMEENPNDKEAVENLQKRVNLSEEELKQLQKIADAYKRVKDTIGLSVNELFQMLNWAGDVAKAVADMSEVLGADEEDVQYWNTVADSLGQIAGGIQDIVSAAMSGNVVGIVSSVLTAIPKMFVGFVNLFNAGKIRDANKEIKKQAELLERLEYTYSRLEKEAEKVFGTDYIANYNRQLKILNAQAEAYRKQAAAERDKGKKADKEKIKEYENAARDTMNNIADMQGQLAEKFLGTNLTSAARDFARAWLDAYKEFGNTADKMSEKFREMIENMVVESLLARVMQRALEPAFTMIDEMREGDFYNPTFWQKVMDSADRGAKAADAGAKVIMEWARDSFGYDPQGTADEFTGIKRDIASASEEQITGLAATMNTWSYYVSFVPGISADVAAIRQAIERGLTSPIAASTTGEWTDWQQQAMNSYLAIQRNTADTVVECRRAAVAAENAVSQLKRVITNNPSNTSYGVKVFA